MRIWYGGSSLAIWLASLSNSLQAAPRSTKDLGANVALADSCPNHKIHLGLLAFHCCLYILTKTKTFRVTLVSNIPNKAMASDFFATSFSTLFSPLPSQFIFNDFLLNSVSGWNLGPLPMALHLDLACSCFSGFLFYFPDLTFPYSWHVCFLLRAFVQAFCFTSILYTVL